MDSLKKVKLEPLIEFVTELSDNINKVVESPSLTEFVHQLPATMTNLNDTLTSYRRLADDARKVIAPLTETAQGHRDARAKGARRDGEKSSSV